MAIAVEMPKLSDTMEEGVVSSWLAQEGDEVKAGDVIAEVETDKATMDLEVYDDGVLLKQMVSEGDAVPLGNLIAVLGEEGEDISDILEKYDQGDGESEAREPEEEEGEQEEEEDVAQDEQEEEEQEKGKDEKDDRQREEAGNGRVIASPLARRLASEHEIELKSLKGSGPHGRIIKRDVEARVEEGEVEEEKVPAGDGAWPGDLTDFDEDGYESESISQMRKTISRRLAGSKFTAPHFYLTIDIDVAGAEEARKRINERLEKEDGSRISFNDIITKACAHALRRHPQVNSSYLADEGEIRYHKGVHVAIAVAIDEGLITPVIRNADKKGMRRIAAETRELAQKARDRKLQPEEFEGSTFTTSNLGMFGIEEFTAIINPPNACILAIGTIRDEPVVQDGEVVPGRRMKVTLSCDHRVVDGATGAEFLNTLKGFLEDPLSMLL